MSLTQEQQAIVDYISNAKDDCLILINAVAGAGKTFLLTQIVEIVPHTSGIYLAYNKSVATEAAGKFPSSISCSTAHSLAYRGIVKALGLRVGNFSYKDISEKIAYEHKLDIIETIREFCLSSYVDFQQYAADVELVPVKTDLCSKYLTLMYEGKIECTHDFYMKVFHMHLADGSVTYPKQDFLLVDEAGDLNEVTLEIFKLLPAKVKIAVGDSAQNIYSFNHTVNAFELLKDEGIPFRLTESFRVSASIASRIEEFCIEHISEDMRFKGQEDIDVDNIVTTGMLSRTNAGLISAMVNLMEDNINFTLVRRAADIFKLPLTLCFLKYQGTVSDPAYRHIQADVDEWYEDAKLRDDFKSPLLYLASLYHFDIALVSAVRLLMSKGKTTILDTYEFAKSCEKKKTNLFLATCHSVKGLEYDEVIILDDLNESVTKALFPEGTEMTDEDREQELNLYYVACSRARKSLVNAKMLN